MSESADAALIAFNEAKRDRKTHPDEIQRLWEAYCAEVEREMKAKQEDET